VRNFGLLAIRPASSCLQPGIDALPENVGLELSQGDEDVERQLADRRRGVDVFRQ